MISLSQKKQNPEQIRGNSERKDASLPIACRKSRKVHIKLQVTHQLFSPLSHPLLQTPYLLFIIAPFH